MVAVNPVFVAAWIEALRPIRRSLTPAVSAIFRDKHRPETERSLATSILSDYLKDRPEEVAGSLMDAEPKAFVILFSIAEKYPGEVVKVFQAEIERRPADTGDSQAKDQLAERQARAAVALVRLGKAEKVWPLLRHSADPRLRSFIVNWLHPLGVDPRSIVAGLDGIDAKALPTFAEGQQRIDAVLFHPETSMRRAPILALGTYGTEGLTAAERETIIMKLTNLYRNDPDSGIHGAAEWTLRQWNKKYMTIYVNMINLSK